jgi:nucleoid-associated protein YgaU
MKPNPAIEKSAPKTSFAATVAATAPSALPTVPTSPKIDAPVTTTAASDVKADPRQKTDSAEKPDQPRAFDWGLSLKKKRPGLKLKIGAAAVALVCLAGYAAYSQFFAKKSPADGPSRDSTEVAQSEEPRHLASGADSLDTEDPFEETPAVTPAASARSSAVEPRRIGDSPDDAAPIGRSSAAVDQSKKNPLRESLDLDEAEPLELSVDTPLPKSPPGRSINKSASGPSLGDETDSMRRRTVAGRTDAGPMRLRGRPAAAGTGPGAAAGGSDTESGGDSSDEKLEGYNIAQRRATGSASGATGRPAVSIVEVDDDPDRDEKLDGYVPQDVTSHRARSTTLVVRGADADRPRGNAVDQQYASNRRDPRSRSTAFADDSELDGTTASHGDDSEDAFARPTRGELNTIQRRSSPPAPAADGRLFSAPRSEGPSRPSASPASDTYRVLPDDNFWKISRKQYGTARYYQALMRYNQDRVPDPQKLRPGMQILTPPAAVLEQRFPELIERAGTGASSGNGVIDRSAMRPGFEKPLEADDADEPPVRTTRDGGTGYFYGKSGEPLYRIGPDDTLTGIAQRHLGRASRWHEIYEKNQDVLQSPDNLSPGTVIRLPIDASRVSLVPDSDSRR